MQQEFNKRIPNPNAAFVSLAKLDICGRKVELGVIYLRSGSMDEVWAH